MRATPAVRSGASTERGPAPAAPAADAELSPQRALEAERLSLLRRLDGWLEAPLAALGLAWLGLLVVELVWGLSPLLEILGLLIWAVFVVEFAVRVVLAPRKLPFLARNWLTALALFVPALRFVRFAWVARALFAARTARGLRLLRVVSSLNRGMGALGASLGRRGFGYVVALTAAVIVAGAAGMYSFERDLPAGGGLPDYGAALWWTAMLVTTMGSDYWPRTAEGRVLCLLLALYAFAVFGYVTATLATFFVGREATRPDGEVAGAAEVAALRAEVAALRSGEGRRRQHRKPRPPRPGALMARRGGGTPPASPLASSSVPPAAHLEPDGVRVAGAPPTARRGPPGPAAGDPAGTGT
jgi:voltage-gated potassium channel